MVRLDAFVYIWKRAGTNCVNLAENHEVVRLMQVATCAPRPRRRPALISLCAAQDLLELANAEDTLILPSITNVTQAENFAYLSPHGGMPPSCRRDRRCDVLPCAAL